MLCCFNWWNVRQGKMCWGEGTLEQHLKQADRGQLHLTERMLNMPDETSVGLPTIALAPAWEHAETDGAALLSKSFSSASGFVSSRDIDVMPARVRIGVLENYMRKLNNFCLRVNKTWMYCHLRNIKGISLIPNEQHTHHAAMSKSASTSQRHTGCKSKAHFFQNKFDIFRKPTCQLLFFGKR